MNRILIIDDNPAIHEDFKKILIGDAPPPQELALLGAALFGDSTEPKSGGAQFELDSAFQGEEGWRMVKSAVAEGRPYSVAFVDMRMPPGWDGLFTIQRLWEVDPCLQIVICTAYSDHSWDEITKTLGGTDRLLILKKPFDAIEILQLATSLGEKRLACDKRT
jgi:CheY-like chemotaxis protein